MNRNGRLGKERGCSWFLYRVFRDPIQNFPNIFFCQEGWKSCTGGCGGKGTGEVESYRVLSLISRIAGLGRGVGTFFHQCFNLFPQ